MRRKSPFEKYIFDIIVCKSFGLILSFDSPFMDEPYKGTVRFFERLILTNISATQANILTFASSITTHASASHLFIKGLRVRPCNTFEFVIYE